MINKVFVLLSMITFDRMGSRRYTHRPRHGSQSSRTLQAATNALDFAGKQWEISMRRRNQLRPLTDFPS